MKTVRNSRKKIKEFIRESNAIEGVYDEVSFDQALLAWDFLMKHKKMTVGLILKVHKILMLHQNLQPDEKGYIRKCEVTIGGRYGLNSELVPKALEQWALNVNDLVENGKNQPESFYELMTKKHHVVYENIHPFVDGNGRTGRMFLNWERLMVGLPLLIVHEGAEQMEYYKWFRE